MSGVGSIRRQRATAFTEIETASLCQRRVSGGSAEGQRNVRMIVAAHKPTRRIRQEQLKDLRSRRRPIRWPSAAAIAASALLRGCYHLYQGWGGFAGNLVLGLAFGYAFTRWRRTWPLVTAHFVVDTLAGVGYILFRGHCFGSLCIPH